MERLFRSRMDYVAGPRDEECFLCRAAGRRDESDYVLARRGTVFAILNKFPYNTGHVMVAPLRHVGDLAGLSEEERLEVLALTADTVEALRRRMSPHGFNLGANLGEVAGAGLPGHFHLHVVPRWTGDTNFMPVVGEAKVIPETLDETYARLKPLLI